jgi:nucleoid-associated protein YgaU
VSRKRVLLGLFIIAGGVCASLPFRKQSPVAATAATASNNATSPLVGPPHSSSVTAKIGQGFAPPHSLVPSPYLDDGSQQREDLLPLRATRTNSAEEIASVPREETIAPPMLPVSFQVKENSNSLVPWQPARMEEGPASPPRDYRIRRMDTLEDLAERFLGSKEKATELFEANRHVLQDRLVLPIGAVIRIPSGSAGSDLQPVRPQQ